MKDPQVEFFDRHYAKILLEDPAVDTADLKKHSRGFERDGKGNRMFTLNPELEEKLSSETIDKLNVLWQYAMEVII